MNEKEKDNQGSKVYAFLFMLAPVAIVLLSMGLSIFTTVCLFLLPVTALIAMIRKVKRNHDAKNSNRKP